MITKFEKFNEYVYYKGPGAAVGFKTSNPNRPYFLSVDLKINPKNEENVKMILSFYSVPVIGLEFKNKNKKFETLNLKFLSYNENEAESIIKEFFDILNNAGVVYDPKSVMIFPRFNKPTPQIPIIKHKHTFSFFKDKEKKEEPIKKRPVGFKK
mgnify:CR=1 FL=1